MIHRINFLMECQHHYEYFFIKHNVKQVESTWRKGTRNPKDATKNLKKYQNCVPAPGYLTRNYMPARTVDQEMRLDPIDIGPSAWAARAMVKVGIEYDITQY